MECHTTPHAQLMLIASVTYILFVYFIESLNDLLNQLWDAKLKWYNLGLGLGFSSTDLDAISINYSHQTDNCLREILKRWLLKNPQMSRLIQAFKQPSVGLECIVKKLTLSTTTEHDDCIASVSTMTETSGSGECVCFNLILSAFNAIA